MRPHLWHKCPTWLPGMGPDRVGQTIGGGGSYIVFSMVLSKYLEVGGLPAGVFRVEVFFSRWVSGFH